MNERSLANLKPVKPGEVRNPAGRPKGSRNKLGEDFIAAIYADFQKDGATAIAQVRVKRPHEYLKVIASVLPKELHVKDATLGDMTDNELVELLAAVRSLSAADDGAAAGERTRTAKAKVRAESARRAH